MSMFAFIIFPTGEKFTNHILTKVQKKFKILDVIRHRTTKRTVFRDKMIHMYQNIDPSKLHKARAKIAAQGLSTSFLVVVVDGDKKDIRPLKRDIRKYTGVNCIHTADNPDSTREHLEWLLGFGAAPVSKEPMNLKLDQVQDFMSGQFREVGPVKKGNVFTHLRGIFDCLRDHDVNYAVVQMGGPKQKYPIEDTVYDLNKDIEIICSDRTRAIDALGAMFLQKKAMKKPHMGTYLVYVQQPFKNDKKELELGPKRKVKVDFSLSVFVPENWRNRALASKHIGPEGIYIPTDQDTYWLTMFERVIYKPRKFRVGTPKYAEEATWENLIKWGINMGVHPQIRNDTELPECQAMVREYMDRIVP